jgi:DNA-binding NtrC family response regulator
MIKDILIVDDEINMAKGMGEALRRVDFDVDIVYSAKEALNKFEKNIYKMVVSDVRMDNINGKELLKKIKKISPKTVVILVSAYGTIEDAVEIMKEGASDFIVKPFSAEELQKKVKTYFPSDFRILKFNEIIYKSSEMEKILKIGEKSAKSSAPVLIRGESGTGKELLAKYIHNNSNRKDFPYIAINCAAIPENLLESELFGYEKGAFTGATNSKPGKFELADKGTIVLDEISELHPTLQSKLLRVLQEKEVDRLGGVKPIPIDVRLISITNKDIESLVKKGDFREDLYFRINVVPIKIPPLRDRKEDLNYLVNYFLNIFREEAGKNSLKISKSTMELIMSYNWPGNVRELQNVIQRAVLFAEEDKILPSDLFLTESKLNIELPDELMSLQKMEKKMIIYSLKKTNGNRKNAAEILGISERTLRNKVKEYELNVKDIISGNY